MNITDLKYQISLFGSYGEITPNVETIKSFVDLFSDKNLIPNQFTEFNVDITGDNFKNKTISRLRLSTSDNSLSILFKNDRIDFELTNINIGVFSMPDINFFINEVKDYIQKINSIFPNKHKRIGFVTNFISDEIDVEKVQKKFNNRIPFFDKKPTNDWSNRISTRISLDVPSDEIYNVVSDIRKIKANLIIKNKPSIFEGIFLSFDINTINENDLYRFTQENINQYIETIFDIQKDIYTETIDFIKN